jgi:CPA1 family monovalent cation:H+ antiporter
LLWLAVWIGLISLRAWMFPRWAHATRLPRPSVRNSVLVGWCGMRGVVTLATALALPEGFPHRDLLVFAAFSVVLTTLVLQGGTMAPLLRWLKLEDDGAIQRETALARAATARAALATLEQAGGDEVAAAALRADYEDRLRRAEDAAAPTEAPPGLATLRRRLVREERRVLNQLRRSNRIGDVAFHAVEDELDWADENAARRLGVE